jgi:hypothetical protein
MASKRARLACAPRRGLVDDAEELVELRAGVADIGGDLDGEGLGIGHLTPRS